MLQIQIFHLLQQIMELPQSLNIHGLKGQVPGLAGPMPMIIPMIVIPMQVGMFLPRIIDIVELAEVPQLYYMIRGVIVQLKLRQILQY